MQKFSDYSKIPGIKINESVIKMGNIRRVPFVYDVPLQLIQDYQNKVKSETGKNPLDIYAGDTLAELFIKHVLDNYMKLENLPSSMSVGDQETKGEEKTEETEEAPEVQETETAAEEKQPETEIKEGEEAKEETKEEAPALEVPATKEEEEEESDYMNTYTTMGNPVSTGFKINPAVQKQNVNAKVGLHEGLSDKDVK